MRNSAQFKELVYEKACAKKNELKKKRILMTRSIAAFSVCFVIISAVVFSSGDFISNFARAEAECGVAEAKLYNSAKGASVYDGYGMEIADCEIADDVSNFSYMSDSVDFSGNTGGSSLDYSYSENEVAKEITEIAKSECSIEYSDYKIYYNDAEALWKFVFYGTDGDKVKKQIVCVDDNGDLRFVIFEY